MTLDEATSTTMNRRKPSWREKENNRRRERKRRAISTKIYSTLRTQGNYKLPKHCDNNEVLKALCVEAGWIVEEDGTTYRKGCKAAVAGDGVGSSTQNTPLSSQNASPIPSYQVSPSSSSFPSPCLLNANKASNLIPYVGNASLPPLRISNSAPVTPPLYSPTKPIPMPSSFNHYHQHPYLYSFPFPLPFPFSAASAPPSPSHRHLYPPPTMPHFHQSGQWLNFQAFPPSVSSVPISPSPSPSPSPTFNFIQKMTNSEPVKPWVGETIHQEGLDDLELTLGSGKTPA